MMLRSLACLLLVGLIVSATDENQWSKIFCENQLPDKCSPRTVRSIISPFTDLIENLENKLLAKKKILVQDKEAVINCQNDLVIQIVKASISNVDKTKCALNGMVTKEKPCTDIIMTTLLTQKLCNGKTECQLTVGKYYSSFCECSIQKYLDITYKCNQPSLAREDIKHIQKRYLRLNYKLPNQTTGSSDPSTSEPHKSYDPETKESGVTLSGMNKYKEQIRFNLIPWSEIGKNEKSIENNDKIEVEPLRHRGRSYNNRYKNKPYNNRNTKKKYRMNDYKNRNDYKSSSYHRDFYLNNKKDYKKESDKYYKNDDHFYEKDSYHHDDEDYYYDEPDYYHSDYDYYGPSYDDYGYDYNDYDYYGNDYYGGDYYYDEPSDRPSYRNRDYKKRKGSYKYRRD